MSENAERFRTNLGTLCRARDWTDATAPYEIGLALARRHLAVAPITVRRWLEDGTRPRDAHLAALCDLLAVTEAQLLYGDCRGSSVSSIRTAP